MPGAFTRSPDGIRTRATALRGRRARPLHNGAMLNELVVLVVLIELVTLVLRSCSLGYQDSNLD